VAETWFKLRDRHREFAEKLTRDRDLHVHTPKPKLEAYKFKVQKKMTRTTQKSKKIIVETSKLQFR